MLRSWGTLICGRCDSLKVTTLVKFTRFQSAVLSGRLITLTVTIAYVRSLHRNERVQLTHWPGPLYRLRLFVSVRTFLWSADVEGKSLFFNPCSWRSKKWNSLSLNVIAVAGYVSTPLWCGLLSDAHDSTWQPRRSHSPMSSRRYMCDGN
jgi:hypothetical protein